VSDVAIDLQVNHGNCQWATLRSAAQAAQEVGFDTFWIADHLSGEVMGATSMPECFATLGGLAAVTSDIGLGSLVVNTGTRHAGIIANAAATIQLMSGGRFTLGLGAGASPTSTFARELDALDFVVPVALEDRHQRLVEVLDRIDAMWAHDRDVRYRGFPLPSPRPAIILGVNSVALARVAADRADGINVRADHPRRSEILAAVRDRANRPMNVSVWTPFDEGIASLKHDSTRQWLDEGVNRIVLMMSGVPDVARIAAMPIGRR
jgi:alkanesulfonate monooxygenase SsuD/methylene tetrahydromethanopterin reductase-like flavin-dependent oxidoreductase (luciferase family)